MFAFAYGAAFGAIQQMPRIVPGIEEVRVLPPPQIQQTASQVQAYQEFGGLAGRFLLAGLALYIVSRRKLIRAFQIPGLFVMPFVFYYAPTHSLELTKWGMFFAGVFTVGQLSFWGNYLPRVYPTHLRGTGEGFAANIGGRMLGTSFAFVTTTLTNYAPGATPSLRLAFAATVVATFVYTAGFICSFFLPEPEGDSLPGIGCVQCDGACTRALGRHPRSGRCTIAQGALLAKQWPQFRGPGSTGRRRRREPSGHVEHHQNVKWKTTIPGHGWSSPIAWGDRIFVTSVIPVGETETPKRGLYLQGERPAPTIEHRYMVYAIDLRPERSSGSGSCIAAFRRGRDISRTRSRRRRRSPTALASTWRSAMSASSRWISTASWCGRSRLTPQRRATAGAPHRHRSFTMAACISSTTTKTPRR